MEKVNVVKDKSFEFAVRIVNLGRYLVDERREYVLSKQLIRSGTAVGALYREAEQAESPRDFIHKLGIALKECNETAYWLDLLLETKYIEVGQHEVVYGLCIELRKILIAIIKSTKLRMGN
jgi:four helix bundle protein